MRLIRNLLVLGILAGAAYGYFKTHPESRAGSWGWEWIDGLVQRFGGDRAGGDGPTFEHPSDVFDFEITPEWVTGRWDRVTSGLGDPRLPGYRVALVTGYTARDLAGALTYYFDTREQLRRISFVGTTGDARYLVEWVTRRFGFRWRDQNGTAATYAAGRFGRYRGYLRVRPVHNGPTDPADRRYDVEMVVGR